MQRMFSHRQNSQLLAHITQHSKYYVEPWYVTFYSSLAWYDMLPLLDNWTESSYIDQIMFSFIPYQISL